MKRIIVSGKGGSGKTTITSLLITKLIKRNSKTKLLVIDADPSSNLHISLGINKSEKGIGTIDEMFADENNPPTYEEIANVLFKACVSKEKILNTKIDYAFLGHHMKNSCLCGYNNALNFILKGIQNGDIDRKYDFIIIDREAGVEHINRSVYGNVNDYLLIVTWPTEEYLQVADEINKLANMLGTTANRFLIINNIQDITYGGKELEMVLNQTSLKNSEKFLVPKLKTFQGLKKMDPQKILSENKDKIEIFDNIIDQISK